MNVGIPTEIKSDEQRVSLTPAGVAALRAHDPRVRSRRGPGPAADLPTATIAKRAHRSWWNRGDLRADDARASDVHSKRRRALLRDQHARDGAAHVNLRAHQCDVSYALEIADRGILGAGLQNSAIRHGLNIFDGHVVHPAVAQALKMKPHSPWE